MLRIAFDGNEANVTHRVGSNVYAFALLTAMEQLTRHRHDVAVTVLLADPPHQDLPKARAGWQYQVITPARLWTQWAAPLHLFLHQDEYDVFFTPGHYAPRLCSVPYVSSVMDLAFLHFPEQFKKKDLLQLRQWTAYSVKKASRVIAISQYTKQAVMTEYHRQSDEVKVAYPAVDDTPHYILPTRAKSLLRKLGVKQPYLLYVGTLQPRKNVERMITAFEQVQRVLAARGLKGLQTKRAQLPKLQLVIAGKVGWLAEPILQRIKASPFTNQIVVTGYVDEQAKQVLYEHAIASVLVGLYEGFGIPPLESLRFGCVPIVSNTTSLPEVVGPAGILVDPTDIDSIAHGMVKALGMTTKQCAQFQKLAQRQLQKFDWHKSARVVLETLAEVAQAAQKG